MNDILFKLAAKSSIDKLVEESESDYYKNNNDQIAKLSIKYQVLSKETAFIGIVKQKNKS